MLDVMITSIEIGLLYALVVLGVFLTFRILNFPDLTVDGSFVTGAGATAMAIKSGVPGIIAILIGFAAGFLCGSLTVFLHTRLGIGKILSGILSLSLLYTINLRLMAGPNISLLNQENIIYYLKASSDHAHAIIFLLLIILVAMFFVDWFLKTEFGLQLRATGGDETTARSFAINIKLTKFIGVSLSNGFVGAAGGLVAQYQGFADINMGVGIIIFGIAALMLGEAVTTNLKLATVTIVTICGAILFQLIINFALHIGLPATDLKFVTALIVIISLVVADKKKYYHYARQIFDN